MPSIFISESIKTALADCPKTNFVLRSISKRKNFLIFFILHANIVILAFINLTLKDIKRKIVY